MTRATAGYGLHGGRTIGYLPHAETPLETHLRQRAQSYLTRGGKVAELPTLEEARRILTNAQRLEHARREAYWAGICDSGAEPDGAV